MVAKKKRLLVGRDFDGWAWLNINDPDYGTCLDADEIYETREHWASAFKRRGRYIRVRLTPIDPRDAAIIRRAARAEANKRGR